MIYNIKGMDEILSFNIDRIGDHMDFVLKVLCEQIEPGQVSKEIVDKAINELIESDQLSATRIAEKYGIKIKYVNEKSKY